MRKIYREGKRYKKPKRKEKRIYKNKKGIIMNGLKYLLIATVLLFGIVFIVTRFAKSGADDPNKAENATTPPTIISEGDDSMNNTTAEENFTGIEDSWAMFLVNNKNTLDESYDELVSLTLVFQDYRDYYMDSRMADKMLDMLAAAQADGIDLYIVSTHRTIAYQENLFIDSVQERVNNGMSYEEALAETEKYVALPGGSEHNAGVAADIMSRTNTDMSNSGFEDTEEFAWLRDNAENYGFILRYPQNKYDVTGIEYEPWHYRFVGVYYAKELNRLGMTMEEYFAYKGWLDEDGKALYNPNSLSVDDIPANTIGNEPKQTAPPQTAAPATEQSVTIIV